jgi:four helix bundle protein
MDKDRIAFIERLKGRTKQLAIQVIHLFQVLPKTDEARIIGRQLLRSSTSVAANYRAACRARSSAEYYAKISIVVEEADETLFWIELLIESGLVPEKQLLPVKSEAQEILAIMATARKNTGIQKKQ